MDLLVDAFGCLGRCDPAAVEVTVVVVAERGDVDAGINVIGGFMMFG